MINHATTLTDKAEQQKCVDAIITFMGQMNPHLRDVKEFTHKLWDHLHIMSDFKLDIQSPYKKPEIEKLEERPEPMEYPGNKIRFSYYGNTIQTMIETAMKMDDSEKEIMSGMITSSGVSSTAQSTCKASFFAPCGCKSPLSFIPPFTLNVAIYFVFL
jgi:hypothetical protein